MRMFNFIVIFSLFWINRGLNAQCFEEKQVTLTDSLTLVTLAHYVSDARYNHSAFYGKGIYQIVLYTDEEHRKCMSVKTWIDDKYKDNPPLKWGYFWGDRVLLFYEGDSDGNQIRNEPNKEFLACLEKIIADRVYIRPPKMVRYRQIRNQKNEFIIEVDTTKSELLGNDSNNTIFIFEKDGTVKKIRPS